jgi:hypothetical protein
MFAKNLFASLDAVRTKTLPFASFFFKNSAASLVLAIFGSSVVTVTLFFDSKAAERAASFSFLFKVKPKF